MGDHTELPAPVSVRIRKYAKGIVAVAGALGVAVTPLATGDGSIDLPEAIQTVVAFLTALGVIGVRNKKKEI